MLPLAVLRSLRKCQRFDCRAGLKCFESIRIFAVISDCAVSLSAHRNWYKLVTGNGLGSPQMCCRVQPAHGSQAHIWWSSLGASTLSLLRSPQGDKA